MEDSALKEMGEAGKEARDEAEGEEVAKLRAARHVS
jgi:hypothetical protein